MPKKTTVIIILMAGLLMLVPGRRTAADLPAQVTIYTVWYSCIISPPCCNDPVGEWTLNCDGTLTGWGWEPGHNCTTTVVSYGAYCDSGGGGDPGGGGHQRN